MLVGLRHRTVRSGNYEDGTVHLSGTRNHVLHIVGVSGAVHVSVVTVSGLILDVRRVDRDTALLLFGCVVDRVERAKLRQTRFCKYGGNCSGQRRLTVVYVSDGTDVHMRFRTVKFLFCHSCNVLEFKKSLNSRFLRRTTVRRMPHDGYITRFLNLGAEDEAQTRDP